MVKTVVKIDGMMCGMCETHVNEALRKITGVRKVSSSHKKGQSELISESGIPESEIRRVMEPTGYAVLGINEEPYEKKGLFGGLFG
ncbi:MAG: cation transporter [Lachnospiraceae bacterium]|nr:cation transporter [Lachnospiraceae bacterium]